MPEAGGPGAVASVPDVATTGVAAGPARLVNPWRARLWGMAVFAATFAVLFVCYLYESRTQRTESDGASIALNAWDVLHGNVLLHGWTVADVTFYTTEIPEYLIIEALRGLNADVVHLAAAVTYALLVPLAAVLARGRALGREGLFRMLIAAGILVAPEPGAGVFIVLFQPDHLGTQVPMLVTWLVLDRAPRRWFTPVVIGLMLAWIGVGDQVVLLVGVLPLVVVCGLRALRTWRRTMSWREVPQQAWRPDGLRAAWFEISLVVAAVLSYGVADVVVKVLHAAGGYTMQPLSLGLVTLGKLPTHVRLATDGILGFYGANFQGPPTGLNLVFAMLHLVGVALVIWALWLAFRRFFSADDLIAQVLAVGIVINLGAYLLIGRPTAYWSVREMVGILPMGAVLAGRLLGPRLLGSRVAVRPAPQRPVTPGVTKGVTQRLYTGLTAALAMVLAGYLAALGWAVTRPSVPGVGQDLYGWLSDHQLTYGLAEYGLANSTTVASGTAVSVRSVVTEPGRVAIGPFLYNISWYDPAKNDANFVVLLWKPAALDPMTSAQVRAAFGSPTHEYHYKQYLIMTWDKNLLTQLAPPARD